MTVLQALKISVGYPLAQEVLDRILMDRGLSGGDEYRGADRDFTLARADVYMSLVAAPDVSMDGFSFSVADRAMLASLAEGIYRRYEPSSERLSVARDVVRDASDVW